MTTGPSQGSGPARLPGAGQLQGRAGRRRRGRSGWDFTTCNANSWSIFQAVVNWMIARKGDEGGLPKAWAAQETRLQGGAGEVGARSWW